jgi:hypothetical protein
MVDVPHSYVKDHIVAPTYQEYASDLWDHKPINHGALILGQLNEGQRLQAQTDSSSVNFRMSTADDSGCSEAPDPLVIGRCRQPHYGGDLLIGHPGIHLKEANNRPYASMPVLAN